MTYLTNDSSSQIVDFDKISGESATLTRLRHQTSDTQHKMLTTIWEYFCEHNQWMPITLLHHKFGRKRNAWPLLEQLGGSIVFEHQEQDGTTSYELTILGILLTEEGEYYEQLLSDYLAYVVERFVAEPRIREVTSQYDLGLIGGARTFMVQSEMGTAGPSGALLTIQESIKALSPTAVVMVGITFGVDQKKQHIGEILVSRQILTYELQRVGSGLVGEPVIRPRGDRSQASTRMLARFRAGVHNWKDAKVHFGLILSGEKLVDNQDFRDQLRTLEPEAIGGEMEGVGLYGAAQRNKVDWILVKAICDWADGRKNQNKRQRQQKAARNAASFTLHVLQQGGFRDAAIGDHLDRG